MSTYFSDSWSKIKEDAPSAESVKKIGSGLVGIYTVVLIYHHKNSIWNFLTSKSTKGYRFLTNAITCPRDKPIVSSSNCPNCLNNDNDNNDNDNNDNNNDNDNDNNDNDNNDNNDNDNDNDNNDNDNDNDSINKNKNKDN